MLLGRETPSVAGIINPGAEGFQKLFFGQEEIAIPVHSRYFFFFDLFLQNFEIMERYIVILLAYVFSF